MKNTSKQRQKMKTRKLNQLGSENGKPDTDNRFNRARR